MPKGVKKIKEVKVVNTVVSKFGVDTKKEVVKVLLNEIPALFDQFPRGSLSVQGVEKLVDRICFILHG